MGDHTSLKNSASNILLTCSGGCIPPHFSEPIHFQCQFCCLPNAHKGTVQSASRHPEFQGEVKLPSTIRNGSIYTAEPTENKENKIVGRKGGREQDLRNALLSAGFPALHFDL